MTDAADRIERLLADLPSLRALALRLVRDGAAADDAVQDAVLAAMREPQVPDRGYLRSILRNVVRAAARRAARRRRRETEFASRQERTAPSAADVAAALGAHRRLVESVHELDETERQVVFLHFWRGLAAREIAELLGLPSATVHARLQRALGRLRARLDAAPGGRDAWRPALLAFAVPAPVRAAASSPLALAGPLAPTLVLLMNGKSILASLLVVTALALLPWWWPGPGAAAPAADADAPRTPVAASADPSREDDSAPTRVRIDDASSAAGRSRGVAAPAAPPTVHGLVCDLDGRPVAGVDVAFARTADDADPVVDQGVATARSAHDGTFELAAPAARGVLLPLGDAWCAVRRPWLDGGPTDETLVLVVAQRRSYGGTVVDPAGAPVAGARVVVEVGTTLVPTRAVGDRAIALPNDLAATDTDARGAFRFAAVGHVPGATVRASRHPHRDAEVPLPEASAHDLLLRLGEPEPDEQRVFGIVLDHRGRPVEGAFVAALGDAVRTTRDGRFAAPWAWGRRPTLVRAVHPDHGATEARLQPGTGEPGWRAEHPVTLLLPERPGAIAGRVVDHDGRPAAGVRVWTPDLTFLGRVATQMQGREVLRDGSVEGVAAPGNEPLTVAAITAADGTFALRGLVHRPYALFALAPGTLAAAGPLAAAPGDAVELRLQAPAVQRIAGRARSADGQPLAGVRVSLGRTLPWQRPQRDPDPWAGAPFPLDRGGASHLFRDEAVTTDADGRFAFERVHVDGAWLWFDGESVFFAPPFHLVPEHDPERLDVVLPARSSFRIVLARPDEADAFRITDATGGHVTVLVRVEGFEMSMGRIELAGGRSPVASTAAGEVTVTLLRGAEGKENVVRSVAVRLPPGPGHDVRL